VCAADPADRVQGGRGRAAGSATRPGRRVRGYVYHRVVSLRQTESIDPIRARDESTSPSRGRWIFSTAYMWQCWRPIAASPAQPRGASPNGHAAHVPCRLQATGHLAVHPSSGATSGGVDGWWFRPCSANMSHVPTLDRSRTSTTTLRSSILLIPSH
jgi:hypothetical protein